MVDEGIQDTPKESFEPDREQSFIIGAMAYLECLASIIVDQPVESLNYMVRFATLTQGRRVYPNPWTGISTPLFIYLAGTATLVRRKRRLVSLGGQCSDVDLELTRSARELYGLVLAHHPPSAISVDDTQDANTPLAHLFVMDTVFRLVILLELTQDFPEVITHDQPLREVRQASLDLAIAVLTMVSDLPESSGANIMLSVPLLIAGSALQTVEPISRNIHYRYDLSSTSFDALCGQIAALKHCPATLRMWRGQVTWRLEQLYHRVGLAPVKRVIAILEVVWHRADKASDSGTSSSGTLVHWMDVMTEERLETLFG